MTFIEDYNDSLEEDEEENADVEEYEDYSYD